MTCSTRCPAVFAKTSLAGGDRAGQGARWDAGSSSPAGQPAGVAGRFRPCSWRCARALRLRCGRTSFACSIRGGVFGRPEHAIHLRLTGPSGSPARDIATLLKSTFNPNEIGVTFRPSLVGLTVTSKVRDHLDKLEQAITTTPVIRAALEVRRPIRRLPLIKISGVDSSIAPAMPLSQINTQNNLAISADQFRHRTIFTKPFGTKAHVVEVLPRVFSRLMEKGKLHVGLTSCRLTETLDVPTCCKCSSLGHLTMRCEAALVICSNCAEECDTSACTLAEHGNYVCNECRKWRRPCNHYFGASSCTSISAWIERMRNRTDYGEGPNQASSQPTAEP